MEKSEDKMMKESLAQLGGMGTAMKELIESSKKVQATLLNPIPEKERRITLSGIDCMIQQFPDKVIIKIPTKETASMIYEQIDASDKKVVELQHRILNLQTAYSDLSIIHTRIKSKWHYKLALWLKL